MPYNTTAIPPRKDPTGHTQLPLSRVKKIIAADPDISICSNNAAFIITLAAEMFVQHFTQEASDFPKSDRKPRRNLQYRDMANAVSRNDRLEFLEDAVPRVMPYREAKKKAAEVRAKMSATSEGGKNSSTAASASAAAAAAEGEKAGGKKAAGGEDAREAEKKEGEKERKEAKAKARPNGFMPRIVAGADREDRTSPDASDQLKEDMEAASHRVAGETRDRDGDVEMGG